MINIDYIIIKFNILYEYIPDLSENIDRFNDIGNNDIKR